MFQQRKIDKAHEDGIWSISWSQGTLLTSSLDGCIKQWEIVDVNNALVDNNHASFTSPKEVIGINSIVSLIDGSLAIACYQDSSIRFFDLLNKKVQTTLDAGFLEAYALSLSPGEDILVSGSYSGAIHIWSMQEGHEKVTSMETASKSILSTAFSFDGKLAVSGNEGLVQIFDMNTQQLLHKLNGHQLPVRSVAFSGDGSMIFSASDDRCVHLCDLRDGQLAQSFGHESMALSVDASSDYRHFATGCSNGELSLWDLAMQRRTRKVSAHSDALWAVQFDRACASGDRLATAGDDGNAQIFHNVFS